jgi:hypothetical protein
MGSNEPTSPRRRLRTAGIAAGACALALAIIGPTASAAVEGSSAQVAAPVAVPQAPVGEDPLQAAGLPGAISSSVSAKASSAVSSAKAGASSAKASASASAPSSASTVSLTAKSSSSSVGTDTVFTVSGKATDTKEGAKVRLQKQGTSTTGGTSATSWSTLAYTTYTAKDGSYSFQVKLDMPGTYMLRVYHSIDSEGASGASSTFSVTSK